jgi:hypothetical protein
MRPRKKNAPYYLLAFVCALGIFLLLSWIPIINFWLTLAQDGATFLTLIFSTIHILAPALIDTPPTLAIFNASISLLIGYNVSLLIYYWKHYKTTPTQTGITSGALGTLITFLGFGCASCGTFFISSLLASVGAAGLATIPIFNSYLFQTAGILLLTYSTFILYKKTNDPLLCISTT